MWYNRLSKQAKGSEGMGVLICPICKSRLEQEERRFACKNGHSFDLAAAGYLHLLPSNRMRAKIPGDNKQMVQARRDFLSKGYYQPVSDCLNEVVTACCRQIAGRKKPLQLLDAGCGEGYYTNRLAESLRAAGLDFALLGLDISKFAVAAAAKSGRELLDRVQYGVASVFELPVKDHSCQVVTNLFAPVCIPEYRRVLKRGGVLVFAVTSTRHLWELKSAIYDEPYENEKLDHQYEGFELVEKHKVNTVITLPNQQDIDNLFTMTPYYYKSSVESVERLHRLSSLQTQIDVDIIVYKAL